MKLFLQYWLVTYKAPALINPGLGTDERKVVIEKANIGNSVPKS